MIDINSTGRFDYIPSVNAMYSPQMYKKRVGSAFVQIFKGMMLTPEARKFKDQVKEQLEINKIVLDKKTVDWRKGFGLNIIYVMKCSYLKRDLTNLDKAFIDAVCEYLGINDSRILECTIKKLFQPGEFEYVKFRLYQTEDDISAFVVDKN